MNANKAAVSIKNLGLKGLGDGSLLEDSIVAPTRRKKSPSNPQVPSYMQSTNAASRKGQLGVASLRSLRAGGGESGADKVIKEYGAPQTIPALHTSKQTKLEAKDYSKSPSLKERKANETDFKQIEKTCKYIRRDGDNKDKDIDLKDVFGKK